jgi:Tfp pilus assembly protein PilF
MINLAGDNSPRTRSLRRTPGNHGRVISMCVVALGTTLILGGCGSKAALTPGQRLNAGIAAFSESNFSQARSDYKEVIKNDPSNSHGLNKIAWYDLGVLDQQLGHTQAANSEYQQALLIDPRYPNALYNLAVLDTSSNPSRAINLYRRALVLTPANPNIRWNLGLLLYKTGHVIEGRALLKSAIKIDPGIAVKLPKGVKL